LIQNIIDAVVNRSIQKTFPDRDPYRSLSTVTVSSLSAEFGISGKEIEIAALEAGIVPERYARNMKTLSLQDQAALLKSKVSIVGLGGLGGGVTEILSRIGVGTLYLVDGDTFEDHNLNRQFLSKQALLAFPKARAAFERVKEINTSISVFHRQEFLTEENSADLLGHPDVVVDCLDNLPTRRVLERFAKGMKIPLVSAAVAGSSGHLTVIYPEDPGLKMIYGDTIDPRMRGAEASLGALPHAVTLLSSLEASEVLKIILKKGEPTRNRLLVVDLFDNSFEMLQLV
jgi:molybdopterin/thiamine biosynthesis adenylyltransferase